MTTAAEPSEIEKSLVAHRIPSLAANYEPSQTRYQWQTLLFGNFDFSYFFRSVNLYSARPWKSPHLRFRRNDEFTPLMMLVLLGFQHACSALSFILFPALFLGGFYSDSFHFYVMQAAVIIAGIGTILNCLELKKGGVLPFQLGTGLTSILINSTVFLDVFTNCMDRLRLEDGLSVHDAFGRLLCTSAVCSLAYIGLAFIPRRFTKILFPPVVCGVILMLVGLEKLISAAQLWGGGVSCAELPELFPLCEDSGSVHLPFGAAEYLGLGLFVLTLYCICELFGSPFIRHNIITISVFLVFAVTLVLTKDGHRYVNGDHVDEMPPIAFLYTTVYELKFHKGSVLPLLGAFLVTYLETTVILTGTLEESRIALTEQEADDRIQGGLIVSAFVSLFSVLSTGLPLAPCSYNNTIINITNQAPKDIGVATGVWLVVLGILGKLLGLYLEMPGSLRGAMGVLLISGVVWTGLKILTRVKWNRRTSIIVLFSFSFGLAGIVENTFINDNLWELDQDKSEFVISFRSAVILMMQVPYFLGGIVAVLLNLILPSTMELTDDEELLPEMIENE
eukprot:g4454.t1